MRVILWVWLLVGSVFGSEKDESRVKRNSLFAGLGSLFGDAVNGFAEAFNRIDPATVQRTGDQLGNLASSFLGANKGSQLHLSNSPLGKLSGQPSSLPSLISIIYFPLVKINF